MTTTHIAQLSDSDLVTATKQAATSEQGATARLVALLAEFDTRRLYLAQGCASLFVYCTSILHLSEHAAYHRIEAARAARQYPVILDRLSAGDVTLTAVGLLRPHLTAGNHIALLDAARHQTKRDVERLIAGLAPKADITPLVRRVALVRPLSAAPSDRVIALAGPSSPQGSQPAPVSASAASLFEQPVASTKTRAAMPSSDDRYLVRLTISGETHAKLQRARDLLRHAIPNGDPAAIVDRALTVLVEQLEKTKFAATAKPRAGRSSRGRGRQTPAAVRRAVWARDGARCTFSGLEGRCTETGCLEFHHVTPYAHGGRTDAANLTLRCRAHNAYDARLVFGDRRSCVPGTGARST